MRRKKHLFWLAAVGLFVLVGVAAATQPHPQTADVSAAFTADQTRSHSRTCTQDGNTFRITNAVWRGTVDERRARLVAISSSRRARSSNETTGDGWLSGTWRSKAPASNAPGQGRPPARERTALGSHRQRQPPRRPRDRPGRAPLGSPARQLVGDGHRQHPVRRARREHARAPDNSALLYRGGC